MYPCRPLAVWVTVLVGGFLFSKGVVGKEFPETYLKPNLYFGTRTAEAEPVSTGLMWYASDRIDLLRHEAKQEDKLRQWGWIEHDGRAYGKHKLTDKNNAVVVETSFVKHEQQDGQEVWHATIAMNRTKTVHKGLKGRDDVTVVFYVWDEAAEEAMEELEAAPAGQNVVGGDAFTLSFQHDRDAEDTRVFGQYVPPADLWKAKESVMPHFHNSWAAQMDKELKKRNAKNKGKKKKKRKSRKREMMEVKNVFPRLPNEFEEQANFVTVQKVFQLPFEMTVTFSPKALSPEAPLPNFSQLSEVHSGEFLSRFEDVFRLQSKGLEGEAFGEKYISFAKAAFSNLIGSITYFHGSSLVKNPQKGASPSLSEAGPLVTGVPSRSFFPRGFLWDEGFHQLLVVEWDPDITIKVLKHWFSRMDEKGWIPREQILGNEALSKVPSQFQVQSPDVANPPALLLSVERLLDIAGKDAVADEMEVGPNGVASSPGDGRPSLATRTATFLKEVNPKLKLWYSWLKRTQKGPERGTFRWRGRTKTHTLASGLDDYPRGEFPSDADRHVDLLSWMAYAAGTLRRLSKLLGDAETEQFYKTDEKLYLSNLQKHWHEEDGVFYDFGINDVVRDPNTGRPVSLAPPELVRHFGYASIFPLALRLLKPEDPRLGRLLGAIQSHGRMWSKFGLRSLSKDDALFGKEENYWRGKIWININFLVLKALREYGSIAGPYKAKSQELYEELRTNVVRNIYNQYRTGGFIYENYDSENGRGAGCHPFTGWSSLVVLIMSERY